MLLVRVFIFSVIAFIAVSCGKKVENNDPDSGGDSPRKPSSTPTYTDEDMQAEKLSCARDLNCPDNIAKIVIKETKKTNYCSGILVNEKLVLTNASCLPKKMRTKNYRCDHNTFMVFPKTFFRPEKAVRCKKVHYADSPIFRDYPALWQNNIAVLEIEGDINRSYAYLSRAGIQHEKKYDAWSVKVDEENENIATIQKTRCKALVNTYLNPFSKRKHSGMFVGKGCEVDKLRTGALLFSGINSVFGVFSMKAKKETIEYLKSRGVITGKISTYAHFSNLSCSSFSPWYETPRTVPESCLIDHSIGDLDRARSNILKGALVHQERMEDIKKNVIRKLKRQNNFFKWNLEFASTRRGGAFELHLARPECIWDSNSWIRNYRDGRWIKTFARVQIKLPYYHFTTKLNGDLRGYSVVKSGASKNYTVEFNPYGAHALNNTRVTIKSNLFGRYNQNIHENVTDNCESLF